MNPRHLFIAGALLVVFASALTGCTRGQADAALPEMPPPEVTVSRPLHKTLTQYTTFTGTTEALESVDIRARVEGVLTRIHFTPGDRVKKGDLLFSLDPATYQARLEEAGAALAMREAELKAIKATSSRRENAFRDKAVSEVEVIRAKADLAVAKAAIKAARAAVKQAKLDLSYTRIAAPVSGRIGRSLVDAGNLVGSGERTILTTLINDDRIFAYFTVNERELLTFQDSLKAQPSPARKNTRVFLGLANQKTFPFKGSIDYIHNRMDAASGTLRIRAVFPNSGHTLIAGLFARIKVPLGAARPELLVPETALGQDRQGHYLLLADAKDMVRYQPVVTGHRVGGMRVVRQGLAVDDRVIVKGIQRARPGARVTATEAPVSTAKADVKQAHPGV